jgi:hypothetical protein
MLMFSMLPVGLLQAWASIERGTWYARSSEFMQSGTMNTLRWMRVPGDILFAVGAVLFAWFVLGLVHGGIPIEIRRISIWILRYPMRKKNGSQRSPVVEQTSNIAATPWSSPCRNRMNPRG